MFSDDGGKTWKEWTSAIDNPTFDNIYAITLEGDLPVLVGEDGLVLKGDADCKNFKPMPGPFTATLFDAVNNGSGGLLLFGIGGGVYLSTNSGGTWKAISLGTDSVIEFRGAAGFWRHAFGIARWKLVYERHYTPKLPPNLCILAFRDSRNGGCAWTVIWSWSGMVGSASYRQRRFR